MTPNTTHDLIVLAAGFSGLLAGASADRGLVQIPAWRRFDVMTWAEHSRHADLGNGRFWYPLLAVGATGLSIGAAFGVHTSAIVVPGLATPTYLAAFCELAGLSLTALAAPNMIRFAHLRIAQPRSVAFGFSITGAFHGRFFRLRRSRYSCGRSGCLSERDDVRERSSRGVICVYPHSSVVKTARPGRTSDMCRNRSGRFKQSVE
jgi:hypothetical protein